MAIAELAEKVDQVLAEIAAAPIQAPTWNGTKVLQAKLRDGSETQVELTPDMCLGISDDDKERLAEQLRARDIDVESLEIPRQMQTNMTLQWSETLGQAFAKAWMQRVDHVEFCETVARCGETLLALNRPDFAYNELFFRYSDKALQIVTQVGKRDLGEYPARKVGICSRYYLGACTALYKSTIQRDASATRSDTTDILRDVLRDILQSVEIICNETLAVREELYWCIYNACLLAMRIARWLRIHNFGGIAVGPLELLAENMNSCLPLMAVHMLPFRARFMQELASCAEAGKQLSQAARICEQTSEQILAAQKLETMLPPVPAETSKIFEVLLTRQKALKLKYEFWTSKVPDAGQLSARAKEIAPETPVVVSCLLEALNFQHGLPQHFGAEEAKGTLLDGVPEEDPPEGQELTKFSSQDLKSKQADLLGALIDILTPLMEKAELATEVLEEHTVKRLTWEAEEEIRARTDAPTPRPAEGEEEPAEPPPRPERPPAARLEEIGFSVAPGSRMHTLDETLPLDAHIWLVEECLKHELRGNDSRTKGAFETLERSLALRLRYRHFLRPPIVNVDVIVTPEAEPDKVQLPEKFEILTDDLNHYSQRHQPQVGGEGQQQQAKHIFMVGEYFDAWENWTSEYPISIRRLCNLKLAFVSQTDEHKGPPPGAMGLQDLRPLELKGSVSTPWQAAYRAAGAGDSSGFEVFEDSEQSRETLFRKLVKDQVIGYRCLELPVDPHPGSSTPHLTPCLYYSVYDERVVFNRDSQAHRPATPAPVPDDQTLLPDAAAAGEAGGEAKRLNSEQLLPPWSPLMDSVAMASNCIIDITAQVTKHMHVSVPHGKFNGMVRADLRQTPGELQGKPFQSYVMLCASAEAPSVPLVAHRLRILRALHSLWKAKNSDGDAFFSEPSEATPDEPDEDEATSPPGRWKRPEVMDRLLELADCLGRAMGSSPGTELQGQLFVFNSPDFLEDVCTYIFLTFVWPKLYFMQDLLQQDEAKERVLREKDRADFSEWSHVVRKILPLLLRTLEQVQTVDALTLGSAGFALAQLCLKERDSASAQKELALAIVRLERELENAATPGPQQRLDPQVAAALSFDPPSLRSPMFALFQKGSEDAGDLEQDSAQAVVEPGSPNGYPSSPKEGSKSDWNEDDVIILRSLPRAQQDRLDLLAHLYYRWIEASLTVHLRNPNAPIRRKLRPNEVREEDEIKVAGESVSTRLALSNQEAGVLARLGENPYLRCLFFVVVAQRRPDVSFAALGKAIVEADTATTQERKLWLYTEKELLRQQKVVRAKGVFAEEFKKTGKLLNKPLPHLPIVVARIPGSIQLRLPPLLGSPDPPLLPCSRDLDPPAQEYIAKLHSKRLGMRSPAQTMMTCTVFAKPVGVGTAVSEIHKDLPGTGFRCVGGGLVEITGLKPNTNYCFASLYFEGYEHSRPAISSVSETSPPIGSYHPLPITQLRIKICKAALLAGAEGEVALKKAWKPLFDSFCERTAPGEEGDSYGVRTYKLRLDVADRLPPALMSDFADLVLQRNSSASKPQPGQVVVPDFPCTKPKQRALLQSVNECLVAVDCARRAGKAILARQATSLALDLLARLLQYRTRPQLVLAPLAKCLASLEAFPLPDRQLPWHSKARRMVMYLSHQVAVLCVQLGQVGFLTRKLENDLPDRYQLGPLADPDEAAAVRSLVLDQAVVLALLGAETWTYAEQKARVALKDSPDVDELVRMLKELSDRNYTNVARDAVALALREDPPKPPFAMSLLQCAANRAWEQGDIIEHVTSMLDKHPCCRALDDRLDGMRQSYVKYGFMLRANPPARLVFPEEVKAENDEEKQEDPTDEVTIKPPDPDAPVEEEPLPPPKLEEQADCESLAQLELMRAAPLLRELSKIKRLRHDISRFKFLDLQQVSVPLLSPDGATLGVYEDNGEASLPEGEGEYDADPVGDETQQGEGEEEPEWLTKEKADKEAHERAFELLQQILRILARAAGYAAARKADQLLQAALIAALNAILLVGLAPEECVPKGPKSNPMDYDPDKYVGAVEEPKEETVDEDEATRRAAGIVDDEPQEREVDAWLSLAVIAELAVGALQRLKQKLAYVEKRAVNVTDGAVDEDPESKSEEDEAISYANEASKELQGADEELHDVWFEKVPELDVTGVAKLVAFSVLGLYHMRRWSNIIVICREFNQATCSVFATTFMPLMIGAQKEVCNLSSRALANTQRYLSESKSTFEADQKLLPRKLLRQLALQGELSEPEKLFKKRSAHYEAFTKRQKRVHVAWDKLLKCLNDHYFLVSRAIPPAMEMLRKSRLLLADFLQDRQAFCLAVQRKQLVGLELEGRKKVLTLASSTLVSLYRKAVELLRKRQMADQVVQALHELGNLLWLEGDAAGARSAWSDAVDTAYQYVYAIKNWQKCAEEAVSPPQDPARAEIMLLSVVLLAKHAQLTKPKDTSAHLNAALLASHIVEAVLMTAMPNPSSRELFAPCRHRLREIFFGMRETRMLLPPNSVHGGLDGMTFLGAIAFFQNTLTALDYQPARCLPLCSVHNYVATDVCRNLALSIKGRLMAVKALIKCRLLTDAWLAVFSIAKGHDKPRSLLSNEVIDKSILDAQELSATAPFRCQEEPTSEANIQAVVQLHDFVLSPAGAGCGEGEEAVTTRGMGALNLWTFKCLKAEFLITVSSYERVYPKLNEPEEKERLGWLDKADAILSEVWKEVTGTDASCEAWSTASRTALETGGEAPALPDLARLLTDEEGELCAEVRLLKGKIQELKGDLGKAIQEVLYGMYFLQQLASSGVKPGQDCNFGGPGASMQLRSHPGSKSWMRLRRYMVSLLTSQGRLSAARDHIEQGLAETKSARDDVARVELLAAKVKVEVLSGRLLELQGDRHLGAVPAAECCLAVAARSLPVPTPSAVYARMMLFNLLQQNPSLAQLQRNDSSSEALEANGGAEEEVLDPNEMLLLEAQGKIVISPIAKDLQQAARRSEKTAASAKGSTSFRERQQLLADMVEQCVRDLDSLLDVQGFQLRPSNLNSFLDFGPDGNGSEALKPPEQPSLLPPMKPKFADREQSDSREPPNVYLELMPLRLHCELQLAGLRLELGELDKTLPLLQDAEARMARCVHLLPWQYVQLSSLKLKWRRLTYTLGLAKVSASPDAPNAVLFRDPKYFATGLCPPTDSPLYRTFMERAQTPALEGESEWVPPAERIPEEGLQGFLQELLAVARLALREGGNDFQYLMQLFRESLEEVLRVELLLLQTDADRKPNFGRIHAHFGCFVAVAACRKALLFNEKEVPRGAPGPPAVDLDKLPTRAGLDMQRGLQRQSVQGALAYSQAALQAAQKQLLFRAVLRHLLALRRECDLFGGLFRPERLLCDQLHVTLAQASEAYSKGRILDEALLQALESPPEETPVSGDVLVLWTRPDLTARASTGPELPPSECLSILAFICASTPADEEGESAASKPLIARCNNVNLEGLRALANTLSADLGHTKPAAAVAAVHVERRLREVACTLRGSASTEAMLADERLDAAISNLLTELAGDQADPEGAAPKLLDAQLVQAALQAMIRLLDPVVGAAQASHPALGAFLRAVMAPLDIFPGQ